MSPRNYRATVPMDLHDIEGNGLDCFDQISFRWVHENSHPEIFAPNRSNDFFRLLEGNVSFALRIEVKPESVRTLFHGKSGIFFSRNATDFDQERDVACEHHVALVSPFSAATGLRDFMS